MPMCIRVRLNNYTLQHNIHGICPRKAKFVLASTCICRGGGILCFVHVFLNARPPFNCIHEDADAAPDSTSSSIDLMDRILLSRFARVDDKLKLEILSRAV